MLDQYASTIQKVFERIAVLYGSHPGPSILEADTCVCNILTMLDADVCAEIIQTAKQIADKQ